MSAQPVPVTPEQQAFYQDMRDAIATLAAKHQGMGVADMLAVQAVMIGYGIAMFDKKARHQLRSRLINNMDVGTAQQDAKAIPN